MKHIQNLVNKNFKTLCLSTTVVSFSLILLMIRIKLNQTFFLLFLAWNVFLAAIPYAVTIYLKTTSLNNLKLFFWFTIWLLFLPNAPYLVTDLVHLKFAKTSLYWLDILVLFSFALTGLIIFYLSVCDMHQLLKSNLKRLPLTFIRVMLFFLCSFGVYLGRFLRYNSWEIISNPKILFSDIFNILSAPTQNTNAWLFTFGFGSFLLFGHWIFQGLRKL